ncbi:hypothetical protein DXT88_06195 [Herbaspirillum lusitanum]|nr:hypothetical protein [Herbaspirillum lusitanum]
MNHDRLVDTQSEVLAMLRWLQYQRQHYGERDVNVHQRSEAVSWFRIGFATLDEALKFLQEFKSERQRFDFRARWQLPEGAAISLVETAVTAIGNRSNEELALACIPVLITHVLAQRDEVMTTITYEDLAERLDRRDMHGDPMALGMGDVLGRAMLHIDQAAKLMREEVPYLTTVVVDKSGPDRGLPGIGLGGRWPNYPTLSREEKADQVELEYLRILRFGSHWRNVLSVLQLPGDAPDSNAADGNRRDGRAGGESPQHRALKEFIAAQPALVGAQPDIQSHCEYGLRSGDAIDVLFKSATEWIGVEVKASTSDGNLRDYERGLYQVVKYKAVLEAQARIDHPLRPPKVRVLLALELALPLELRPVAKALAVDLIEHIGEQSEFAIAKNMRWSV